MTKSFYTILDLPENATAKQIRDRFMQLARERHPDRIQGEEKEEAELRFQEVTEAFNTLIDPERRLQHDQELKAPAPGASSADMDQIARVYIQRGIQDYRQQDFRGAVQNFETATQENPVEASGWYHLSRALAHDRRALPRAREAIAKACELKPMEAQYLKFAGQLFAESGMFDQAGDYLQRALDWGGSDAVVEEALHAVRRGRKVESGLFGKGS